MTTYYWDILTEKFNITKESGVVGAQRALRSWFLRKYNVEVSGFDVSVQEGVPREVELVLQVPASDLGLPSGLSDDEFIAMTEGEGSEKYDEQGMRYIRELIKDHLMSSWSMGLHPTDPTKVVINYVFK